jgi:hypothetical protein
MDPVSLPTEDWSSGARPFQRLLWGRCQSGGLSSLRREAPAQQYYFQAKIDDRCPRSCARGLPPPAPRLHSTSRSTCVAITFVHPGCALHPVHPGCTSGYGDGWAGMLAGAWSGLCASFSAPAGPGKEPAAPETPAKIGGANHVSIAIDCQARSLRHSLRHGIIFYPLSFLLLPQGVGN